MERAEPEWREFEKAVAAFAAALDSTATVKHDTKLADRHHGGPRQRDVWIEAKVCGHFPVSVLVSCKHLRRKLHSGDIDAFNGELLSSHARLGVIYSYSGFTKPAIEKAKVLEISCCRLYRGGPPEIPAVLSFLAYCCSPQILLSLSPYSNEGHAFATWQNVFDLPTESATGPRTLLDEIVARYHDAEKAAIAHVASSSGIPQPFQAEVRVPLPDKQSSTIHVMARGRWKFYRARLEAYEVNGSYEFTQGNFRGQIATPYVDRFSVEPGAGWERLDEPPLSVTNLVMIVLYQGNTKEALVEGLGPKSIVVQNAARPGNATR